MKSKYEQQNIICVDNYIYKLMIKLQKKLKRSNVSIIEGKWFLDELEIVSELGEGNNRVFGVRDIKSGIEYALKEVVVKSND